MLVVSLTSGAAAAPAGASGALLGAAETGVATVAGTVRETQRLDPRGYAAVLEVDRVLAGALVPGARQRIAWQEASTTRPPRFADGERILVALEPLPTGSLWRQRFPEGDALAVGAGGQAALKAPDGVTIESLSAYLALDATARASSAGTAALLDLVARGAPVLADAALVKVGEQANLDRQLDAPARAAFARLVSDPKRPLALRVAALQMAGERRLLALRPDIVPLAQAGSPLEAPAWNALARMDGGLAAQTALDLLGSERPELRSLALRFGGDAISDEELTQRCADDPAGAVRVAAAETLLARRGATALETALPLLFDRDLDVAREAALVIAGLGPAAVPRLGELLSSRPYDEISELGPTALALSQAGPSGIETLNTIAAGSDDPKRRKLAELALGRLPEPGH